MNGKVEVYNFISQKAQAQDYFQQFGLYTGQFEPETSGKTSVKFPALFLEFSDIGYTSNGGSQRAQSTLTIHVGTKDSKNPDTVMFEALSKAQKLITSLGATEFPIHRVNESQTITESTIQAWAVDYRTVFMDSDAEIELTEVAEWTLELGVDVNESDGNSSETQGGGFATIKNSDESLNQLVQAPGTLILDDISIKSNDESQEIVHPAAKDIVLPNGFNANVPDGTISNSDDSYSVQVAAGGSFELPDIQIFDQNGENPVSVPSVKDIQVPDEFNQPVKAGRLYYRPVLSFVEMSVATHDFAWNVAQGLYDYVAPENPEFDMMLLDYYHTKDNNEFGHNKRFTGLAGGYWDEVAKTYHEANGAITTESLAVGDSLIDHHTGLVWNTKWFLLGLTSWDNQLAKFPVTDQGKSDWRLMSQNEMLSIIGDVSESSQAFPLPSAIYPLGLSWNLTCCVGRSYPNLFRIAAYVQTVRQMTANNGYAVLVRNHSS